MGAPPSPEPGDSQFVMIAAGLGGAVLLLMLVTGIALVQDVGLEPTAAGSGAENRWPSREDLGLGDTPSPREPSAPQPAVKRTGTPFGDDSFGGLIMPPTFGKLKTQDDWSAEESRLLSEGTPKALWKAAHLAAHSRNPWRDYETARSLLYQSLRAGAGVAAFDLAQCFETGRWNTAEDKAEAKRLYQVAREHGITNAKGRVERLEKEGW